MKVNDTIYVAGHTGLVGSAIAERLYSKGLRAVITKTRAELDLTDSAAVEHFFSKLLPEYVFLAAGKVGGIQANMEQPAEFMRENLAIQANIIHNAYKHGTKKLLFFGCACMYPRDCFQPMKEEYLLTGPLEPTNEAYSIAKLAGMKMCQSYDRQYKTNFISCLVENLYGPRDHFNSPDAHVVPALIRKFSAAKSAGEPEVVLMGSGRARRSFLFIDDLVDAALFLMKNYDSPDPINVGGARNCSIAELAEAIRAITGYAGKVRFDTSKPDGMPLKALDPSKLSALGWKAATSLTDGLEKTYAWYLNNAAHNQRTSA